jgi:ferredoxin-type protein NapG
MGKLLKNKSDRRSWLKLIASTAVFLTPATFIGLGRKIHARGYFIRPPGALPEEEFKKQCIGCFKCATACPNNCIEMASFEHGRENVHTPVVVPRSRGCILCMRCTEVCPTGALQEIGREQKVYEKEVKMGVAKLDQSLCFSYHGRTCGVCYRACPLPGKAMTISLLEQPTIHADKCVGCGLCEQACIHMPQAIRVVPV